MSATDPRQIGRLSHQQGVAAVEFALVVIVFLIVVFGIMEIARAMYMFNTLPEVTRIAANAAANISFNDDAALDIARKRAVFDETSGALPFGNPITYEHIRIEYMELPANGMALQIVGTKPSCPAQNRLNCMKDPNSPNAANLTCIRAVQARICQEGKTGGSCTRVTYEPLFPLISLPLSLPTSATIVTAETLGYRTGDLPCG
jgi:hypothetical protein